ncbi:MAG: hypothetical protein KDL10_08860 [Kiritimatiellae bacterium]|nr:hypothetical protein [Kiritimatiellia bacterium]
MIELNDILGNIANVTATIGNALVLVGMTYGFFRLGRKSFFLMYLLATPIIFAMSLLNTISCLGAEVAVAFLPPSFWALAIPMTNALYPIAVVLNVAGMCLLLSFVKKTRESEPEPREYRR